MSKIEHVFYLLPPQKLPHSEKELKSNSNISPLLKLINLPNLIKDDILLDASKQILEELKQHLGDCLAITEDENETLHNKFNDEAFNIVRVNGNIMNVLAYSSVKAYSLMLEDVIEGGTSLNAIEWGEFLYAFKTIFRMYADPTSKFRINKTSKQPLKITKNIEIESYKRWVNGHYVFMVIIQALNIALNCYLSTLNTDLIKSRSYLKKATFLMNASAYALKYAGDFSRQSYMKKVRPTLMPPISPPELSGLNWRDHEYLIKNCFKRLKASLLIKDPFLTQVIKEFKISLAKTYDSHKYVCGKFIGQNDSSLLTRKPAVDVIDNFKKSRLHMLNEEH